MDGDGSDLPADQRDCVARESHGSPFRYCRSCSWVESAVIAGVPVPRAAIEALAWSLGRRPRDVRQIVIKPNEVLVELYALDDDGKPLVDGDDVKTVSVLHPVL